jgi:hypothetical protein
MKLTNEQKNVYNNFLKVEEEMYQDHIKWVQKNSELHDKLEETGIDFYSTDLHEMKSNFKRNYLIMIENLFGYMDGHLDILEEVQSLLYEFTEE